MTRVGIPDDVDLREEGLFDRVREHLVPCNTVAVRALAAMHQGATVEAVAQRLAPDDPHRLQRHLLMTVHHLNRAALVNTSSLAELRHWLTGLCHGLLVPPPSPSRRRHALLEDGRMQVALRAGAAALAPASLTASVTILGLMTMLTLTDALAVGLGLGLGVVMHEALHALVLWPAPAYLLTSLGTVRLVHQPLPSGRRRAVALAGPAPVGLLGVLLLLTSPGLGTQAMFALGLTLHLLSLLPLAPDGRNLFKTQQQKEWSPMRALKAFLSGAVTVLIVAVAFAAVASLAGPASWADTDLSFLGVDFMLIKATDHGLAVGFGPLLPVLAVFLGVVNAALATALARRGEAEPR